MKSFSLTQKCKFMFLIVSFFLTNCDSNNDVDNTIDESTVNHVSGTIQEGGEIIISGDNFGNPSVDNRPVLYFDGSSAALSPLGKNTLIPESNETLQFANDTEIEPFGNAVGSIRYTPDPDEFSTSTIGGFAIDGEFLYVAQPRYFNHDIYEPEAAGGYNLKHLRMWQLNNGGSIANGNTYYGVNNNVLMTENSPGDNADYMDNTVPQNSWQFFEALFIESDIDTKNGIFLVRFDGNYPNNIDEFRITRTNEYPDSYKKLFFDQRSNGSPSGNTNYHIYSGQTIVYDSPYIVWISDSEDINVAKIREPMIIKSWSENQIVAQVRQGRFVNFDDAYLIITVGYDRGDLNDPKTAGFTQLEARKIQ